MNPQSHHFVSEPIKVILVDNHILWRESFPATLNSMAGIKVVGTAAEGGELFEMIKTTPFDIVLLDLQIKVGIDGYRTLELAAEKNLDIKFIIMSSIDTESIIEYCMQKGARGYLTKNTDFDIIGAAIFEVHTKGHCRDITTRVSKKSVDELRAELRIRYNLTERDIKVFIKLVEGKAIKVIAGDLNVADRSVNRILREIGKKTRAESRPEMISFAIAHGIAWKPPKFH